MSEKRPLDLVVLVPGSDEYEVVDELLSQRWASLEIRHIRYRIVKHPQRDPGCFHGGPQVLQPYQRQTERALIFLDHEGSGQEKRAAEDIAADLRERLRLSGWENRAEVVVIEPELEIWVWSDSPEVDRVLGWRGRSRGLRPWMVKNGYWSEGELKPSRPKECLEAALREVTIRRSAAIYRELAASVGLERCRDESFLRFKSILHSWFAPSMS